MIYFTPKISKQKIQTPPFDPNHDDVVEFPTTHILVGFAPVEDPDFINGSDKVDGRR